MADTTSDRYVATQAIREWLKAVLSLSDALVITEPFVPASSNSPPPPRPNAAYCGVLWVGSRAVGVPYVERGTDGDGNPTERAVVQCQANIQIRFCGPDSGPWPDMMLRSLGYRSVNQILWDAGLVVYAADVTSRADVLRDRVAWEIGTILEVAVSYLSTDADPVSGIPIEEVVITAEPPTPAQIIDIVVEA